MKAFFFIGAGAGAGVRAGASEKNIQSQLKMDQLCNTAGNSCSNMAL